MSDNHFLALSELQVWSGGRNLALGKTVRFADATELDGWAPEALVDGHSSRFELLDWTTWLDGIERARILRSEAAAIRARQTARREARHQQLLKASIIFAAIIAMTSVITILLIRNRAGRSREALRQRIARDLHDEIGASLSHLAMQSELAGASLENGTLKPDRLDKIALTARETLDHMRDVIWLLAPTPGDWDELSQRLENIAARLLDGVSDDVRIGGVPPSGRPPIDWSRELVSYFKESLTNARRHSKAKRVDVSVLWEGDELRLSISDDGRGFDPQSPPKENSHGLGNLKRRAAALKGDHRIDSKPGRGTRIELTVPIPRTEKNDLDH